MIKVKIRVADEDKFGILLQLLKQRIHSNLYSVENIEVDDKNYMFFMIEYKHPKFINKILLEIRGISEIIQFPIEYAFVYNKQEAYTDIDNVTNQTVFYNTINYLGEC